MYIPLPTLSHLSQVNWGDEFARTGSAMLLKITTSSDDLAWLTPFLMYKAWYFIPYLISMEIVVVISVALAFGGTQLIEEITCDNCYWDASRVLSAVSSVGLTMFAFYLYWEYLNDEDESDDSLEAIEVDEIGLEDSVVGSDVGNPLTWGTEEVILWWENTLPPFAQDFVWVVEDNNVNGSELLNLDFISLTEYGIKKMVVMKILNEIEILRQESGIRKYSAYYVDENQAEAIGGSQAKLLGSDTNSQSNVRMSAARVMFVTLMGSFDEIVLLPPLLKSNAMNWYQMAIGVGLGSGFVVLCCFFITRLGPIANFIQKLPVHWVIGLFAIYSWLSTFFF